LLLTVGLGAWTARAQGLFSGQTRQERIKQWLQQKGAQADAEAENDAHFSIDYGGLTRKYNVHLPSDYNANTPMPAVIFLHGGGGSMRGAYWEGMNHSADKLGFILVIPDGTGRIADRYLVWNAGQRGDSACCGYAVKNNIDDVGFISAMIDQLKAKFNVDSSRIYATGISNGGSMSYRLACELSGKIAAVATVAGWTEDRCSPSRPVAVMHVHGTGDLMSPYNGGQTGVFMGGQKGACVTIGPNGQPDQGPQHPCLGPPASETVDTWLKKDQCSVNPSTVYQNGAVTCVSYNQCAGGSEVEFCTVEGGGHTWPSGMQYALVSKIGPVNHDMSFDQMWDFLKRHSLK